MKFEKRTPAQSLNQAYRKEHLEAKEFEQFRIALEKLLEQMEKQREENTKNLMSDFLKDAYYKNLHAINASEHSDIDAVIHHQDTQKSPVGVMIENKKPNSNEFVSVDNLNKKSFQQLILYYLQERIENKNTEVKRLIITDVYEWFIFDETEFDKVFYQNKGLVKKYNDFQRSKKSTKHFYEEIAQPFIADSEQEITYTHFDLRDYENELESFKKNFTKKDNEKEEEKEDEIEQTDQIAQQKEQKDEKKLIHLYKILSPVHLLKKPFANDSNSLNKDFYNELLHILGLEEVKEQSKKIIKRKNTKEREYGSFLENTLQNLEQKRKDRIENFKTYGENDTERLENIALELCITWTNRILFLKLLEAQLLHYHKNEKKEIRQKYRFLNIETIKNFKLLDDLFFSILAKKPENRGKYSTNFSHIPYLNSSLFEETSLESYAVNVNALSDDEPITLYSKTVLKDGNGIRRNGKETPLSYFFQFLDAYNFSSEGTEEIRKDKKTLINASVLGLIFEKINGYKDGSFYTPSFITMYMCRQTLRRAVVQKFSEEYKMEFENFEDLQEFIKPQYKSIDTIKNNKIFDSLKICDPAVGSGHFLVSALNELITIKSELGILADENGKGLPVEMRIENDELFAFETQTEFFEYQIGNKVSQTIQKTLFHEKQKLIENCLFGVDINPNSVKICRLRLWIELLKNAYYTKESNYKDLETLPNIDINIKTGNSLISRFDLDADISKALKKSKWTIDSYRIAVQTYRNATSKEQKYEMEQLIDTIKADFRSEVSKKDPKVLSLSKKVAELQTLLTQTSVFELSKTEQKAKDKKTETLEKEVLHLNREIEDIKSSKIYQNAFEWRFEFPEVLDNKGNFIGFDVVIGNPPYVNFRDIKEKDSKNYLSSKYKITEYQSDLFIAFIELSYFLIKTKGQFGFIIPNSATNNLNNSLVRKFILEKSSIISLVNTPIGVFPDAVVDTIVLITNLLPNKENIVTAYDVENEFFSIIRKIKQEEFINNDNYYFDFITTLQDKIILKKIEENTIQLIDITDSTSGIKEYETGKGKPKQSQQDRIDKIFNSDKKTDKSYRKHIEGADVAHYFIKWQKGYLKYGEWLAAARNSDFFEGERIIIREIPAKNRLIAAYTNEDFTVKNTAHVFVPQKDIDSKYIVAILNSKLMGYYFVNKFSERDDVFPKAKIGQCRLLPIKKINIDNQQPFITLVESILSLKKANPKADTSELESEIDDLVYELYGLSEEDIRIVNGE